VCGNASVVAAALLVAEGIDAIVVGSAALWLHGEDLPVNDLDVAVAPDAANLARVPAALAAMGALTGHHLTVKTLEEADLISVITSYGRVDLMLQTGRQQFTELAPRSGTFNLFGASVTVASRADAWALRAWFKGVEGRA
jgi:hypothetical protein